MRVSWVAALERSPSGSVFAGLVHVWYVRRAERAPIEHVSTRGVSASMRRRRSTHPRRCSLVVAPAWLALATTASARPPSGTAFIYQGHLKKRGVPLNRTSAEVVTRWDSSLGGLTVGASLTALNSNLVNGLSAADLDCGPRTFNGDARWLHIAFRHPAGADVCGTSSSTSGFGLWGSGTTTSAAMIGARVRAEYAVASASCDARRFAHGRSAPVGVRPPPETAPSIARKRPRRGRSARSGVRGTCCPLAQPALPSWPWETRR